MRMATSNGLEMVGIDMFEGSFSIGRGPCRLPALPIINFTHTLLVQNHIVVLFVLCNLEHEQDGQRLARTVDEEQRINCGVASGFWEVVLVLLQTVFLDRVMLF